MTKLEELKKYIVDHAIPHEINVRGGIELWFVPFSEMKNTDRAYIMSPYFSECGFSGISGITF